MTDADESTEIEPANRSSASRARTWARRAVIAASVWALLTFGFHFSAGKSAVAVGIAYAMFRASLAMIRPLAMPVPEPPEAGQLRKVKLLYRCSVCGSEVRMTVANIEDPEPPRHCMEDMDLMTPIE